jgi:hypothetical protein
VSRDQITDPKAGIQDSLVPMVTMYEVSLWSKGAREANAI